MSREDALREAARRWTLRPDGEHTGGQTLTTAWLGIGCESEYRSAVKAGLMRPAFPARDPRPRIPCWWVLTDNGAAALVSLLLRADRTP